MKRVVTVCGVVMLCGASALGAVNVALNKPVWTNAPDNLVSVGNPVSNAVDGDPATNWNSGIVGTMSNPVVLTIDLQDIYSVNEIDMFADALPEAGRYISYSLFTSIDAVSWNPLTSGDLASILNPRPQKLEFEPVSMRYLQYNVTGGTIWAHCYEMQVFETPEPATLSLLAIGGLILNRRRK